MNRLEKYKDNDNDDLYYKGKNDIENLFEEINEDYYKPIKNKSAFEDNCIEYESRGDKDKNLSLENYLDIIKPFLRDMKNNHKAHGELKIQLTIKINFISFLDRGEFRTMHLKSDNAKIMIGFEADDINELFESSLKHYERK